jgi:hydrogenase nickel incorporation protein HypA/HybF
LHELSIAQSVVSIAERSAGGRRVAVVRLQVGYLRQVVPDALAFAFELVAEGTLVEGAALEIESVPAAGVCRTCGARSELREFPFRCSRCGGLELELTAGEELSVEELELEEQELEQTLTTTGGTADGH